MKLRIVEENHWNRALSTFLPEYKVQRYGKLFGLLWARWWTVGTRITEAAAKSLAEEIIGPPAKAKIIWEFESKEP